MLVALKSLTHHLGWRGFLRSHVCTDKLTAVRGKSDL